MTRGTRFELESENSRVRGKKLFVGNLHHDVENHDLQKLFDTCGKIEDIYIPIAKGFGFVTFQRRSDADYAIDKYHRKDFEGKSLIVEHAQPRRF